MDNLCREEDRELLKRAQALRQRGEDKIVGFIYESYDYDRFKKLLGNREIDKANLARVEASMLNKQLPIPGTINELDQIVDAQTRHKVASENGLPFIYTVAPGLGIDDCRIANTNSKHWTIRNVLDTFVAKGNDNYKRFTSLMDEFSISVSVAMKATGAYFHKAKDRDKVIEAGALIITEEKYEEGREYLRKATQCYEALNSQRKATKREAAIQAFMACAKAVGYDHKRMLRACEMASLKWVDTNKHGDFLEQIAGYYNFKRKQNFMDVITAKKNTRPVFTATENNYQ